MNDATRNKGSQANFPLWFGALVALGLFWVHGRALDYVVDDAYISFRYAEHFAAGQGLVYNLTERVEGYTNFLWVLLLAGVRRAFRSCDMLHASQWIGMGAGAVVLALCAIWFAGRRPHATGVGLVALLILAGSTSFCAYATSGMETSTVALSLTLAVMLMNREIEQDASPWSSAFLLGLLGLLRADGFVFFLVLLAGRTWESWRRGRPLLGRKTLVWIGLFLLINVPYLLWRRYYYGEWLPNTFSAKVGSSAAQYVRGLRYVAFFVAYNGGLLLLPLMALPLLRREREVFPRLAWSLLLGWTAYVVYVGGDGLFSFRFFVPLMPIIAITVADGVYELRTWAQATGGRISRVSLVSAGIALTCALTLHGALQTAEVLVFRPNRSIKPFRHFDTYFAERCAAAGRWLDKNAPPGAVIASTPAGALAYYANRTVIDMLGLNDKHIARAPIVEAGRGRPGHERGDGKYVLARNPDYILLGNVAVGPEALDEKDIERTLCQKSEHELWALPEFHAEYELRTVPLGEPSPFQHFTFYQRKP